MADTPASGGAVPIPNESGAGEDARLDAARQTAARDRAATTVTRAYDAVVTASEGYRDATAKRAAAVRVRTDMLVANLALANAGSASVLTAVFGGLLLLLAILVLDATILSGAIEHLISFVHQFPDGVPLGLVLFATAMIVGIELGISLWAGTYRQAATDGDERAARLARTLRVFGILVALAVTSMAAATLLAEQKLAGAEWDLPQVLLFAAPITLAFVCHSLVVLVGADLLERMRLAWLNGRILLSERAARRQRGRANRGWRAYSAASDTYATAHGELLPRLRVQPQDAQLINTAIGTPVITIPAPENPDPAGVAERNGAAPANLEPRPQLEMLGPAANGHDALPQAAAPAGEAHTDPAAPQTNGATPPPAEQADAADGENEEMAYLRGVLEARNRDADGEIRA
jgi:hypothetical protein